MDLSGLKQRILIALLCFIAMGFSTITASTIFNETLGVRSLSAETKQHRQNTMEQLLQKMDESTGSLEPIKTPGKPAESKKATIPSESAASSLKPTVTSQPVESTKAPARPAKPVEPVKLAEPVKPVEPVKPAEPTKTAEPVKPTEQAKKAEPVEAIEKEKDSEKVSIDFSDVPLNEILATIAQSTDLNIIGGEEVSQKITVHLKDVPLDALFDILLKSTDYGYIQEGKVLRIIPKGDLPIATEVFTLKFASAEKIMEAAAHLLSERGKVKSFSNFVQNSYTNILIVTDTPEAIQEVRALIEKLDKKVKQVMIEVKFCEVTLNKDDELGIDWAITATVKGGTSYSTFPFGRAYERTLEPVAPVDRETNIGSASLDGTDEMVGKVGTVDFSTFTATLHALDKKTKVKLIANPRVATRSGEPAQIIIGDKVPIPTYERSRETGSMEITGYEFENIGILLQVTPVVNIDNTVTLNIHPEVSEITDYVGPNDERPVVSTREISTVFTVADGETIVLGGLKKQTQTSVESKVPFLGKIPLLGRAFFTYKDDSDERKELLLFITPHVLDDSNKEIAGK